MDTTAVSGSCREIGFDEAWYLDAYPDIAEAVREGALPSTLFHYMTFGCDEGRFPAPFDSTWYAATYPAAVREVPSLDPLSLREHYLKVGRFRGYCPHPDAVRPNNPAKTPSEFGGLWIDNSNARDLIAGKYAIGQLNQRDVSLLSSFIQNGYVALPGALAPALADRAEEALENAYSGGVPSQLFECPGLAPRGFPWTPEIKDHPAKALDLHWWSEDIRNSIFCDEIVHFLKLVFERPAMASQTLGFYRGSGQALHQDSAYVAYSLPLQFVASWIALEDVAVGAGELEYLVGSHKALPEYRYPGGYKNVSESERHGGDHDVIVTAIESHERQIVDECRRLGLRRDSFIAKRGDILFWHSELAHGGAPISLSRSRKSIVTHYCPWEVAPLYFENRPALVRKHGACSYYSSEIYHATGPG